MGRKRDGCEGEAYAYCGAARDASRNVGELNPKVEERSGDN